VLAGFAIQFLAVFWVWNGFTYDTERFESEGVEHRLLGFAAVVPVAGLAVFGGDGLTEGFVGFVLSYLLARLLNIACWVWASVHCPEFRPVAVRFVAGFVVAVVLIVVGLVLGPPVGIVLFLIAVVVEIAAPSTTVRRQAALPALSTSRFPERFGSSRSSCSARACSRRSVR
jgi:low temperature requirement protein LtrA